MTYFLYNTVTVIGIVFIVNIYIWKVDYENTVKSGKHYDLSLDSIYKQVIKFIIARVLCKHNKRNIGIF